MKKYFILCFLFSWMVVSPPPLEVIFKSDLSGETLVDATSSPLTLMENTDPFLDGQLDFFPRNEGLKAIWGADMLSPEIPSFIAVSESFFYHCQNIHALRVIALDEFFAFLNGYEVLGGCYDGCGFHFAPFGGRFFQKCKMNTFQFEAGYFGDTPTPALIYQLIQRGSCNQICNEQHGWSCDNSNPPNCQEICGDGLIVGDEQCDDGNFDDLDGCSHLCRLQTDYVYDCHQHPYRYYRTRPGYHESECVATCGDGVRLGAEQCDNGGGNGDGCSVNCLVESGWECEGPLGQPSLCHEKDNLCGDGYRLWNIGEVCDDGNRIDGDGCSSTCQPEVGYVCEGVLPSICTKCGNGALDGGEQCDDGNTVSADGCSNACSIQAGFICSSAVPSVCEVDPASIPVEPPPPPVPTCDGVFSLDEECDDGNNNNNDGCDNCRLQTGWTCNNVINFPSVCALTPVCGNGLLESSNSESCDDGNFIDGDGCTLCVIDSKWDCTGGEGQLSTCFRVFVCGDGVRENLEECDDGNSASGDGCNSVCRIEGGFDCLTLQNPPSPSVCFVEMSGSTDFCGDGILNNNEQCEDGNTVSLDGCSSVCVVEMGWDCSSGVCVRRCGNLVVDVGETCDDGNLVSGDGCDGACQVENGFDCSVSPCVPFCGNGVIDQGRGETCEDGNFNSQDGCFQCRIQFGWACSGIPSICSLCGNGVYEPPNQQCDDGDMNPLNGCSNSCVRNFNVACSNVPFQKTVCVLTQPNFCNTEYRVQAVLLTPAAQNALVGTTFEGMTTILQVIEGIVFEENGRLNYQPQLEGLLYARLKDVAVKDFEAIYTNLHFCIGF